MKFFKAITASAAVISTSFMAVEPAESSQNFYSTCTIKRVSTGQVKHQKCNADGSRMLDGRHQVTRIFLENGNVIEKDGRAWNYYGPDCLENGKDYIVCR